MGMSQRYSPPGSHQTESRLSLDADGVGDGDVRVLSVSTSVRC